MAQPIPGPPLKGVHLLERRRQGAQTGEYARADTLPHWCRSKLHQKSVCTWLLPMYHTASTGFRTFVSGLGCVGWFCGLEPRNRGTAEPAHDNQKRFSGKLY